MEKRNSRLRKCVSRMLSVVLAAAVLIGALSVACFWGEGSRAKAADAAGPYIALGDSIGAGFGLPNPATDSYAAQLGAKLDVSSTVNLSVTGATSSDMLSKLSDPAVTSQLSTASVITISIGSNDILGPFTAYALSAFGVTSLEQIQTTNPVSLMLGIPTLKASISADATNPAGMTAGAAKLAANFPQIISALKVIAPNAEIYVNNIYNPYRGFNLVTLDFNLGALADTFINTANSTVFSAASPDYKLVDAYSLFNATDGLVNGNLAAFNFDPHPSAAGHTALANAYYECMKQTSKHIKTEAEEVTLAAAKVKSATKAKDTKKAKIVLKKVSGAEGYEIKLSVSNKLKKNVINAASKKTTITVKKLKPNKQYYVAARAYKTVDGKKIYGDWGKTVKVKCK